MGFRERLGYLRFLCLIVHLTLFHYLLNMLPCHKILKVRKTLFRLNHNPKRPFQCNSSPKSTLEPFSKLASQKRLFSPCSPDYSGYHRYHQTLYSRFHPYSTYFSGTLSTEWQTSWKKLGTFVGAVAGFGGAFWGYQHAKAETRSSEGEEMALPADPWALMNEKPKEVKNESISLVHRFARFLWRIFRWVTGIELAIITLRFISKLLRYLRDTTYEKVLSKIFRFVTQNSDFARQVDPYIIAQELASYISEFSGTHLSHAGVIQALQKEILDSLPKSVLELQKERYRPMDTVNWLQPYVSTNTYEEILLSPQFTSFLVESKKDGGIYLLEGYFSVIGAESRAIPLLMCYSQVSDSLNALKGGKVLEEWISSLNRSRVIGQHCDVVKDMSTEYRAAYMMSDIDRMLSEADWTRYLGIPKSEAIITREKSKTPQWDKWCIEGPLGSIHTSIEYSPRALASSIEIVLPETNQTLEHRTTLYPASIICSRWCNYAERHPILNSILGNDIKMVSPPTSQDSTSNGSDFSGSINETWFTCAGSNGQLTLHFKTGSDQSQDGRSPIAPVLSIWADTDAGRIDIYENPREKFKELTETGKTIPIVIGSQQAPFMVSQIAYIERPS